MGFAYRSNTAWALYGFFAGAGAAFALFIALIRVAVIQEERSPYDFATTVKAITASASERGWNVSRVSGFQNALPPDLKGEPVEVLELCHSGYACQLLRSHRRSCLAMMPCSIAVYQRNGQVYVASLNRGLIGRLFRREAAGVLRQVRADEREILHLHTTH